MKATHGRNRWLVDPRWIRTDPNKRWQPRICSACKESIDLKHVPKRKQRELFELIDNLFDNISLNSVTHYQRQTLPTFVTTQPSPPYVTTPQSSQPTVTTPQPSPPSVTTPQPSPPSFTIPQCARNTCHSEALWHWVCHTSCYKMLSFKEMARSMNQKYPRAKHQDSDSETDQCRNKVVFATLSGDEDFL